MSKPLTPYERWMLQSNLATIRVGGVPAAVQIAYLRANGYRRIADALRKCLKH